MLALGPLLTMFLAALAGLERLRLRSLVGAVVSIGGIAVVFGSDASLAVPATSLLALLAAATSFSAAGIVAKLLRGAEPVMQNAIATGIGAIVLLGISAIRAETWTLPHTPGTWLAFAYLVVPGTVVIFLLFLALLRRWSATAVSYQFILAPIVSIALATQVLGEPIRPEVVVGAVLVLVGVYIGAIARGPAPPADATGA